MKDGYRLIIVDKAGVLVSEFQLTERALAQPETFVAALKQSIEDIEEEAPYYSAIGQRMPGLAVPMRRLRFLDESYRDSLW